MKAWYFSNEDKRLRYGDGRLIRAGTMHTVSGTPKLCNHGLKDGSRILSTTNRGSVMNLGVVGVSVASIFASYYLMLAVINIINLI